MAARIIWICDQDGCPTTAEVAASLGLDGQITHPDEWSPKGWGGLHAETLCPRHERARLKRFWAENPNVEAFA